MPRETLTSRMRWPRDRFWRPGELVTLEIGGEMLTCRLRGVMRDTDPRSSYATVTLEPVRRLALETGAPDVPDDLSAAG